MLRRYVLAALATGIEAGNDELARDAIRRGDWVLRGAASRCLEHALIDAALLTNTHVSAAEPETMRHVQRVAALGVARRIDVDVTDRAAVEAAFAELAPRPVPSAPVATLATGSFLAAVLILFVWLAVSPRRIERALRPQPVFVTGAYFHGGTPARDAELENFLVDNVTTLVIETDADRRGSREGAARAARIRELRDAKVIAARGAGLASTWRELIDSLDRWADVTGRGKNLRNAAADLGRRAQDLNEQFAALGLGYYLQADTMMNKGAHATVFVYGVEDVSFVRAGRATQRVLALRRLDRLNLTYALLGRQNNELGDPVILLDQIEEFVGDKVMPAVDGGRYPLGETGWGNTASGAAIGYPAGAAIRRELLAVLGTAADQRASALPRVRAIVEASVRRHEARHAIDYARETPLRYPKAVAALVGPRDQGTRRLELELAAYLSQIGNDPVTPQLALWNLASQGFNRDRWGSVESTVAAIVIEGLARQFGIDKGPVIGRSLRPDRDRMTALAEMLAAQSSDKLRMAARSLWIELYGEPMLPIVDVRAAR